MSTASRVARETWTALEDRIREAEPRLVSRLPPGAAGARLDAAEATLGVPLPPLARELYMMHDGIGMPASVEHAGITYAESSYFLSLADALAAWTFMRDMLQSGHLPDEPVSAVVGGVRREWWNVRWIPIEADNGGNYHCLDLDPAPGGHVGQVISFWHDEGERAVVADDLATYLLDSVDEYEWAASVFE